MNKFWNKILGIKVKKSKVRIFFKSGNSILLEVVKFNLTRTGEDITKLSWTNPVPNIMFIALPSIEAVFEEE